VAGSIDGHIQATKPCDRLVNQAAHIVLVAHIGAQKLGFGAQLAELATSSWALGVVRPEATMRPPSFARRVLLARPIPVSAPVINTKDPS